MIVSRIEDLFSNQVGVGKEKRKANDEQEGANERNVKAARK